MSSPRNTFYSRVEPVFDFEHLPSTCSELGGCKKCNNTCIFQLCQMSAFSCIKTSLKGRNVASSIYIKLYKYVPITHNARALVFILRFLAVRRLGLRSALLSEPTVAGWCPTRAPKPLNGRNPQVNSRPCEFKMGGRWGMALSFLNDLGWHFLGFAAGGEDPRSGSSTQLLYGSNKY